MKIESLAICTLLFCAISLSWVGVSNAQFSVCNRSFDVLNIAIGTEVPNTDATFKTVGWWTVGANACVDPIADELTTRFVYVYAKDVFGQPVVEGEVSMCVKGSRFEIEGIDDCWQRGLVAAKFLEVDTRNTSRWTLFVEVPAN